MILICQDMLGIYCSHPQCNPMRHYRNAWFCRGSTLFSGWWFEPLWKIFIGIIIPNMVEHTTHTQEHRHTWEVMFDISFFSVCCPFVMAAKASLSLWAKLTGLKKWCLCWHPSCTRRCPWRACRYVYTTNGECLRWRKTHQMFLRPLQNKNVKTCHFPSF